MSPSWAIYSLVMSAAKMNSLETSILYCAIHFDHLIIPI